MRMTNAQGVCEVLKVLASYSPSSTKTVDATTIRARANNNLKNWRKSSDLLAGLQDRHIAGYPTPVLRTVAELDALLAAPAKTGVYAASTGGAYCSSFVLLVMISTAAFVGDLPKL